MVIKKNKQNLEQHLDGGNLDLSMMEITDIPVSKIAAIYKATSLDLSDNTIISLPVSFAASLTRLVKLDLSKNKIVDLPENFGLLINLKHLDLYSNRLESLPLSFANLKSLRWLDVKRNPLMPKLAEIAGSCQDERQCQDAAKNIVATFRTMQDQINAEMVRRKEEQLKKLEKSENVAAKNKENRQKKKKKKKSANTVDKTVNLCNEESPIVNDSGAIVKDSNINLSTEPRKKIPPKSGIFKKVGRVLSRVTNFIVMCTLLVFLLGFLLSIIDEHFYQSLQKKGSFLLRSNIPKPYLKHWDNGILMSKRAITSWSNYTVSQSVLWFNKMQDYIIAVSNNEVVLQYLETIQSGWHILWIYLSETYITVSLELSKYFNALIKTEDDSVLGQS